MNAYVEWKSMFTKEMGAMCSGECKELRKIAMLLHAFDKEVLTTRNYLQNEYKTFGMQIQEIKAKESEPIAQIFAKPKFRTSIKNLKPSSTVTKEEPIPMLLPKDSPDLFNVSSPDVNLNQNILSDELIMSSPEKCSPKIKKKRYLHKIKSKELKKSMNANMPSISKRNLDDIILATPEIGKAIKIPPKRTAKKKLFAQKPGKQSENMITITQLFNNEACQRTRHKSEVNMSQKEEVVNISHKEKVTNTLQTKIIQLKENDAEMSNSQGDSMISVDDVIKMVEGVNQHNQEQQNETEIQSTYQAACEKQRCKFCDARRSPCPKHRKPIVLKEPDQTYSDFWALNFTVNGNKNVGESKDTMDDSTILI